MTNREEAKMTQEQPNPTNQDKNMEITKARSRVTINTPAQECNTLPTFLNVLIQMKKSGKSERVLLLRLYGRKSQLNLKLDHIYSKQS